MKHRKHFYISIKYIFSMWVGSIVEITPLSDILFRTIKERDINTLALFLLREVIVTIMKLFLSRGLLSSRAADYFISSQSCDVFSHAYTYTTAKHIHVFSFIF